MGFPAYLTGRGTSLIWSSNFIAFSSGVGTGSRQESALEQEIGELRPLLAGPRSVGLQRADAFGERSAAFGDGGCAGNVIGGLLPGRLARTFNEIRPYGFLLLYALMFTGRLNDLVGPPYYLLLSWLPQR